MRIAPIVLMAVWCVVTAQALDTVTGVKVRCANDDSCSVEFPLDNGQQHKVELVPDLDSVFAPDAVAAFHSKGGLKVPISSRETFGVRYRSRPGDIKLMGASVLLSKDRRSLIEGTFATPDGLVEFSPDENNQASRRRLQGEIEDDLVLANPNGMPWVVKDVDRNRDIHAADYPPQTYIPFFPGCYPGDSSVHTVKLNLVFDAGLYSSLASDVSGETAKINKILSDLETFFGYGKLIYLQQFNIRLEIGKVVFGKSTDPVPVSRGGATCVSAQTAFTEFIRWVKDANAADPTGYWILLSNCFSGTTGVSYVGNLCGTSNNGGVAKYTWSTVFHELGHALGSQHSFEYGVGLTGGIMDYVNIFYNGLVQFHPLKKLDMCPFLTYLRNANCPHFQRASSDATCGDSILDKDEECECLTSKSKSCGACVNCKLTDKNAQCSSSDFILRQPGMADVVIVEPSALSSSECCVNNRLAPPRTLCGEDKLDVCSAGGRCEKVCRNKLEWNNKNCGFDDTGCLQGCIWSGKCLFNLPIVWDDGSIVSASAVPDGTTCYVKGGSTLGLCHRGVCLARNPSPTEPTLSPPLETVSEPPTNAPVSAAVLTNKPTPAPSLRPTAAPTTKEEKENQRCSNFKASAKCKKKNCAWCGAIKTCVRKGGCAAAKAAKKG